MKLSRKSDYALRALVNLADEYGQGPISVRELAAKNDIPPRFLEQILLALKREGWVVSIPGRDGGFILGKPPEQISMGQIVRFFDGVLAPITCVSTSHYEPCSQESHCRFRRVLLDIRNYTARRMEEASLAKVTQNTPVRNSEVFTGAFVFGDGI